MTFIFTLQSSGNAGRVLDGNGEYIAIVPIGYDNESGDVFSIFTAFSPSGGDGPREYEFIFKVTRANSTFESVVDYWDGLETVSVFPLKSQRQLVFTELCDMLRALISLANPIRLTMMTHTSNLPKKALLKFQKLAIVMREEGFDARRVASMNGSHMWIGIR